MSLDSLYSVGKAISETGIYKKKELLFKHFPSLKIEKKEPPEVKSRSGLVTKIFSIYFFLTLLIILLFIIGVFGDRLDNIRLISEASARQLTGEIAADLQLIQPQKKLNNKKKIDAVLKAVAAFNQLDIVELQDYVVLDFGNSKTYDDDDSILYASIPNKDNNAILAEIKDITQAKIKREVFNKQASFKFLDGGQKFKVFIPFSLVDKEVQVFVTTLSSEAFQREIDATQRTFIIVIGFIVLAQIIFGVYLIRVLIKPIRALQEAALTVAAGDLSARTPLYGRSDEVETLSEAFNFMAHVLEGHREEMNAYVDTLELHAQVMHNELDMAASIQRGMLPEKSPEISTRVDIGIHYEPLEKVSGDYYDMTIDDSGNLGILIADASGHGIPAALITIMAKSGFAEKERLLTKPAELMTELNKYMCSRITTDDFISAFFMMIAPDNNALFCNGGHSKVLYQNKTTGNIDELDSNGFMMGIIEDLGGRAEYQEHEMKLTPGDRLIFYTDGIVEAQNTAGEPYGLEGLKKALVDLRQPDCQSTVDKVVAHFLDYCADKPQTDDFTILCLEIKSP